MTVSVRYAPHEALMDLRFEGNLDVSAAMPVCDLCKRIPRDLDLCVLDLSRVERVFDSGIALVQMLAGRLAGRGARVSVVGDTALARRLARDQACGAASAGPHAAEPGDGART